MSSSPTTVTVSMRSRNHETTGNTTKSKRKSTSLPSETVEYLKNWMMSPEHIAHPYPTEQEKVKIMEDTGIELKQLTNWFVNNRKRYWKPRVEARLHEQSKAKDLPVPPIKTTAEESTTTTTTTATDAPVAVVSQALAKVISNSSMTSLDKSHSANGTTVTPMTSPGRAVSEASTSASDSESVSSCEEDVGEQEHTIRIDLHILKPLSGKEPTEADMTTLSNITADRILRSFKDCYITYRIPVNATLRQEQSRREVELLELKKRLLTIYFEERDRALADKAVAEAKKRSAAALLLSKAVDDSQTENVSPRPKFRRISIDIWKDACRKATHAHDESLPSLEEATQLFGFTRRTN